MSQRGPGITWNNPKIADWRARTSAPIFPNPEWAEEQIRTTQPNKFLLIQSGGNPHAIPLGAGDILILFKDGVSCFAADFVPR